MQREGKKTKVPTENLVDKIQVLVNDCERSFVKGAFEDALTSGIQALAGAGKVLSDSLETPDGSITICLGDVPCFHSSSGTSSMHDTASELLVRISSNVSLEDRAAAVILQSSYEIIKREKGEASTLKVLDIDGPILAYYLGRGKVYGSRRSMPLPVAVLWIQFCFTSSRQDQASMVSVEMAACLLHSLLHPGKELHESTTDCLEDLCWSFFTRMLPLVSPASYVQSIMERIRTERWRPLTSSATTSLRIKRSSLDIQSVSAILSSWESTLPSTVPLDSCRHELERILSDMSEDEKREVDSFSNSRENEKILSRRRTAELSVLVPTLRRLRDLDWWRKDVMPRLLSLFQINVIHPLVYDEHRWENRGRAVLAVWTCWIAWKRRRRLGGAVSKSTLLLLSPLREVLEALLPPQR